MTNKTLRIWYIFAKEYEGSCKSSVSLLTQLDEAEAPKLKFILIVKIELQLIAAFVLSVGGLVLLFCGIFIDPQGQIHETLLVAFGETATFAGALFGIDYVYKKKK